MRLFKNCKEPTEMSQTVTSKAPLTLSQLKVVVPHAKSHIIVKKVVTLKSLAVIRCLVRNYESTEYAFRNLFRNSYIRIIGQNKERATDEIQEIYDVGAEKNRKEILSQLANITQYFQKVLDTFQETADTENVQITQEYTHPQDVELIIEVPEMNSIANLFDIGDLVHIYADNLYLAGFITLDDKNSLTTEFASKVKNLAKNASIKANASQKLGNTLKAKITITPT